jgi:hypothetical protein
MTKLLENLATVSVQGSDIVVRSLNRQAAGKFLSEILRLYPPRRFARFVAAQISRRGSLEYNHTREVHPHHHALIMLSQDFYENFARVQQA